MGSWAWTVVPGRRQVLAWHRKSAADTPGRPISAQRKVSVFVLCYLVQELSFTESAAGGYCLWQKEALNGVSFLQCVKPVTCCCTRWFTVDVQRCCRDVGLHTAEWQDYWWIMSSRQHGAKRCRNNLSSYTFIQIFSSPMKRFCKWSIWMNWVVKSSRHYYLAVTCLSLTTALQFLSFSISMKGTPT